MSAALPLLRGARGVFCILIILVPVISSAEKLPLPLLHHPFLLLSKAVGLHL